MPTAESTLPLVAASMRRHPTLRSTPMNLGISATWAAFRTLIQAAQRADDTLHPEWRETPVDRPVFIFASARSGTTMLHRLLSLDESRWATIKLYQTVFPTVTVERMFEAVRADPQLARLTSAIPRMLDRRFFEGWKGVHTMGLDEPEEDEALFVYAGTSPTLTLLLPYADEVGVTAELDSLPPEEREPILDYYEASLRRFLHASGGGRRLLNKNVFTGPRLRSLASRFEDGQFVFLVRHPYESLGSYLSMWYRAWEVHRPEIAKDSDESRAFARMALRHYRESLESRSVLGDDRLIVVRYDDLATDPERTVTRLYDRLGESMSPGFRAELHAATSRQRDYRSEHAYSLEEFGISRAWLREQVPEVYDEFGFDL